MQRTQLRENTGETLAHYCGTQHGAKRLWSADGRTPLSHHCLLTVKRMAVDQVTLAGAHPPHIKGKLVFLTLQQWNSMFKLVHTTDPQKMAKRVATAVSHQKAETIAAPSTHPECCVTPHFHTQPTSEKRLSQTNTVFDVRGDAVIKGDVMLGVVWDGDYARVVLRVPREALDRSKHYDYKTAVAADYDTVPTVPNNVWKAIEGLGGWQTSQSLENKCYRAVGFVRIVEGDDQTKPEFEDPFFLVLVRVCESPEDISPRFQDDCDVYFVPRHEHGQPSFMLSDLPSQHGILNLLAFNRKHSTWMQVCYTEPLCCCVCSSRHTVESHVACHMFHVTVQHIHVAIVYFHVTVQHIHVAIVYFYVTTAKFHASQ